MNEPRYPQHAKGCWLDTMRNIVHRVKGSRAMDGSIWWSNMTRCRHVQTVPSRHVVEDGVAITCLFCLSLRDG